MAEKKVGKIVQVIGPVIDVEFEAGHHPFLSRPDEFARSLVAAIEQE